MRKNKNIKTVMCVVPGITLALALASPLSSYADSTNASAKVTIQTSYLNVIGPITNSTAGTNISSGWQTVLEQDLKMANNHDLLMVASFEVGLLTSTTVMSKNLVADTSTATASVKVRALVDGVEAPPGEWVYGKPTQTLPAP